MLLLDPPALEQARSDFKRDRVAKIPISVGALLGPAWDTRLVDVACNHAVRVYTRGRGPGSLEAEETAGLDYWVLHSGHVREFLPWLWTNFYCSRHVLDTVNAVIGESLHTEDKLEALNVNVMRGTRTRYELHHDPWPYVGLLYATRHPKGGGLIVQLTDGTERTYQPEIGDFLVMDGTVLGHAVQPLEDDLRVSVPMTFYPEHLRDEDEDALNAYLYSGQRPPDA